MAIPDQHPPAHLKLNFHESLPIPLFVGEGDQQRVFYVHETLLTTVSEYFRTALQGNFIEGQEKICRFPEDNVPAFYAFVQFLYKGTYKCSTAHPDGNQQSWFRLHARCFALGNKLVAPSFKKYVVYRCASVLASGRCPETPTIPTMLAMADDIYSGTLPEDGHDMRDLLAEYCASRFGRVKREDGDGSPACWETADIRALVESQQEEFITDVMSKVGAAPNINAVEFMKRHYPKARMLL